VGAVALGGHVVHVAIARIEAARVEALLYDFGNVLVEIDFRRVTARWAELAGVAAAEVERRFLPGFAYKSHERGQLDAAGYYASLREDLGLALDDAALAEGWNAVFGEPIEPTIEAVRRLAPSMPQYLLSNTNAAHYAHWSKRYERELAPLRRQFVSHLMGSRKPDRVAYEHVAREIGVPIDRVLFFDDLAENVEGARAAGMQAVHVRSPADVATALRPWLGDPRGPA
jgi:HAD superfamily hydrolase (TIGR01509 family)